MKKILYLYVLMFSGCTLFSHKKTVLDAPIFGYYNMAAMNIKSEESNSNFIKTDTLQGIEIDYYYIVDTKCFNLKFFIPEQFINYKKQLIDYFLHAKIGIVEYNTMDQLNAHIYCANDTFYYSKMQNLYFEHNFNHYPKGAKVFMLSQNEFVKTFKVNVIIDKFNGNRYLYKKMFPMATKNRIFHNRTVQWQYRKVINRELLKTMKPFKLNETNKTIVKCMSTY